MLRRLSELGDEGERWLQSIDARLNTLEQLWDCRIGEALSGGSAAFVASAVDRSGRSAVVKISIPAAGTGYSGFEREHDVLMSLGPAAYVEVLESDRTHRALLLERLGAPLAEIIPDVAQQIDVLAETIAAGWGPIGSTLPLPSGAEQLEWLREFIDVESRRSSRSVESPTIAKAMAFIDRRLASFDPSHSLVIHGDAHPTNVLAHGVSGFKLIDPEGLLSEPAHDLAIPMRGWVDELLTGDTPRLAASWCQQLADCAGVDVDAIWEWAFIERVSTGRLLCRLASPDGPDHLQSADLIRDVEW